MERLLRQQIGAVSVFFGSSFFLHLLWENLQAPLYVGYVSFSQHFWICFKATGGDLLFMLVIYIALTIMHRDLFWVANRAVYSHPATWLLPMFVGLLLAISFELWAIHVNHRWTYTGMPIIPLLKIGLTPILQMLIIPLVTLSATSRIARRI